MKISIYYTVFCLILINDISSLFLGNPIDIAKKTKNKIIDLITPNNNTEDSLEKEHGKLSVLPRKQIVDITKGFTKLTKDVKTKLQMIHLIGNESNNEILTKMAEVLQPIFPGTLWCGGGSKAKTSEDIGLFQKTDRCCKDHDNCPNSIPAGETKSNLMNDGLFTRSHCHCDDEFYDCLQNVNSPVSIGIKTFYFNILGPQCFEENGHNESNAKHYIWRDSKK